MIFCDWISIYQVHSKGCPVVNSGHVFSVDQDGVVEWDINKKVTHKGSFSTKLTIASDGNRVSFSGNISRFNRQDNVFGYSVSDCVKLVNKVLLTYGLPEFYDCAPMALMGKGGSSPTEIKSLFKPLELVTTANQLDLRKDCDSGFQAVGCVITRLDLTCNYASGSSGNASQVIRKMQGYKSGKFEPKSYFSSGVSWGEGSKWTYSKVYDKASDYIRHNGVGSKNHDPILFDFILKYGVVRHEIELKSRYLKQNNLWRLSVWKNEMESKVYALFTDPIRQTSFVDEFLEIPGRAGELAVAWRDGADLKKRISKPTFYRYRKELLNFGIDISIPSNVQRLKTHIEVIVLSPLSLPEFYSLPKVG